MLSQGSMIPDILLSPYSVAEFSLLISILTSLSAIYDDVEFSAAISHQWLPMCKKPKTWL